MTQIAVDAVYEWSARIHGKKIWNTATVTN